MEAEPPHLGEAARLWPEINFGNPTNIDAMTGSLSSDGQRALQQWGFAAGVLPDGNTFVEALQRRSSIVRPMGRLLRGSRSLAHRHLHRAPVRGRRRSATALRRVQRILHGHRVIMATNALGLPSVVIPVGVSDGLPQSVQIIGPRFAELACLNAAETIERTVGTLTPIDPVNPII